MRCGAGCGSSRCRSTMRERAARRRPRSRFAPVALLHGQGHARAASSACFRRDVAPLEERPRDDPASRVSIAGAVASLMLILVVFELIRGRRLKERYALLWLATGSCSSSSRSGARA